MTGRLRAALDAVPRSPRAVCSGLAVLALLAWAFGTGVAGIDFGRHWDEGPFTLRPLARAVRAGRPLPGIYNYPSLMFDLGLLTLAPDAVRLAAQDRGGRALGAALAEVAGSAAFHLRLRTVFLAVSLGSVVWVYLTARTWGRGAGEAWLAAAALALSWEVAYHARWIAPDAVMMQFGALTLLAVLLARRDAGRPSARHRWLVLAAVAAGLACGTKYPGGLLAVPVGLAALGPGPAPWRPRLRLAAALASVFCLTVVAITPGMLLEPARFHQELVEQMAVYQGGWYGHTVRPGWEHLRGLLEYYALAALSPWPSIAAGAAGLALLGAWDSLRRDRATALIYLSFPVVYVAYFALQRIFYVRNYLVVLPVLALLAARGVSVAGGLAAGAPGGRWWRAAGATGIGAVVLLHAGWVAAAAASVRAGLSASTVGEVARFVDARPTTRFLLSPRLASDLAAWDARPRPNVTTDARAPAEAVALYAFDVGAKRDRWRWPGTRWDLTVAAFGPREVNFNYYPTWVGSDRIVVIRRRYADALLEAWPGTGAAGAGVGTSGPAGPGAPPRAGPAPPKAPGRPEFGPAVR